MFEMMNLPKDTQIGWIGVGFWMKHSYINKLWASL